MGRVSFENFGPPRYVRNFLDGIGRPLLFSGFYRAVHCRRYAGKLRLGPSNTLLEIGCGAGNLLISLARLVGSAIGIDHENLPAEARRAIFLYPPSSRQFSRYSDFRAFLQDPDI